MPRVIELVRELLLVRHRSIYAVGIRACSRWLSDATPPDRVRTRTLASRRDASSGSDLRGVDVAYESLGIVGLQSLRDVA
jgi:hypothetical protein